MSPPALTPRRSRGATLIEVLVALLVLAFGLLGLARLQTHGRQEASIARQRSEATRLGQEDIEAARAYTRLDGAAASGVPSSYADIGAHSATAVAAASPSTEFALARAVSTSTAAALKWSHTRIAWPDHQGQANQLRLATALPGTDPALSGALVVQNTRQRTPGRGGAAPGLPVTARDLGDGRSAFKPSSDVAVVWVADTVSGRILSVCENGIQPMQRIEDIPAALLTDCREAPGLLLSGLLRWSLSTPPQPLAQANDPPQTASLRLTLSGGPYPAAPVCVSEAKKLVRYTTLVGPQTVEVPLAAAPGFLGLGAWTELGERYSRYLCVISPTGEPPVWSGRSGVVPQGWVIGSAANEVKVCRVAVDLDGSGAIDHNDEHPADYQAVDTLLVAQNFLLIRGDQPCPALAQVGPLGPAAAALQHQP